MIDTDGRTGLEVVLASEFEGANSEGQGCGWRLKDKAGGLD